MIVAVIDYRAGNLASVMKGLTAAGADPRVVTDTSDCEGAEAIVVPGVGHFEATRAISDRDRQAIGDFVRAGVPLLGICLGMQWLFEGSEEAPGLPGLGVFGGRCARLDQYVGRGFSRADVARSGSQGRDDDRAVARLKPRPTYDGELAIKIPHVGWNTLERTDRPSRLLDGLPAGVTAYFTHSYAAPIGEETVACTTHGAPFASVVERGRVFGAQFHPEKSGATGVEMLRRFMQVAREANTRC